MEKHDGRPAGAVRLDDPWYDTLARGQAGQGAAEREDAGEEPAQQPDGRTYTDGDVHTHTDGDTRTYTDGTEPGDEARGDAAPADDAPTGTTPSAPAWPGLPAQRAGAPERPGDPTHADVYLTVQRSAAFQEVRRRYRSFVVPATALFLTWYLAYVIAAVTVPGVMARQVLGPLNVAMLAGLGQFVTTFLLTWAYARHARLRRDRAALDLRWETQEMTGGNVR
ncbi:DUF485 domain-containing protein [Streptomyces sp. CA-132043]|uniref:DUF485 domain-containing protein n=1 Tax=Streptomyces sp. CA-132043 TaxID=3240048 RepID=UPI003D930739